MNKLSNEAELVEQAMQGGSDAFRTLFDLYKVPVYNFLYRMLGATAEVEDVLQEVFVRVYRKLPTLKQPEYFSSWLFSIARNQALNSIRSRERRPNDSLDDETQVRMEDLQQNGAAAMQSPQKISEQHELEDALHRALQAISASYREAFVLGVIEGHSYKEVARILGCSVGNVKARVFRARAQLCELLNPYLKTEL